MSAQRPRRWAVLTGSFAAAFALTLVPLPETFEYWRPDWVALTLIYWAMALPWRVGLGIGWLLGLLLDVVYGTLLGLHGLAMVIMAYLVLRFYLQFRAFPVWQQSLVVLVLLTVYHFPVFWMSGLTGISEPVMGWPAIVAGAIIWPWVFAILRGIRRRYRLL